MVRSKPSRFYTIYQAFTRFLCQNSATSLPLFLTSLAIRRARGRLTEATTGVRNLDTGRFWVAIVRSPKYQQNWNASNSSCVSRHC
jgi:hypothetical protein